MFSPGLAVPCGLWRLCNEECVWGVLPSEGEGGKESSSEAVPAEFELSSSGLTRDCSPLF